MLEPRRTQDTVPVVAELVPPHLKPVLVALLSGATDVAASHRLNVSPRTFSRRVAELMDHLGVQTRFQAGVEIASITWRARLLQQGGLTVVDRLPLSAVRERR